MEKILIVDDHAVVRTGLQQFLAGSEEFEIDGMAASAQEALALLRRALFDLVILDLTLQDLSGLELLKRIKHEYPAMPVLIFSMHSEDMFAMDAFKAGAAGYLEKSAAPGDILEAIRKVSRGDKYLSPVLAEKLLRGTLRGSAPAPHDTLSEREFEVMLMLSRGLALTTIARKLGLSVKTISTYRSRLLEKLALGSNAELTRYVISHKLDGGPLA